MKGLLQKDLYLTAKYWRLTLAVCLALLIFSVFVPWQGFFVVYPCAMLSMLPSSLYIYDDREKWVRYVLSLPVSRRQYVAEKYLFGLLSLGVFLAIMTLIYLVPGRAYLPGALLTSLTLGLAAPALSLPFLIRFGAERGRIVHLLVMGAIFGSAAVFSTVSGSGSSALPAAPLPSRWLLPLIAAALYGLSCLLSIRFFEKREL